MPNRQNRIRSEYLDTKAFFIVSMIHCCFSSWDPIRINARQQLILAMDTVIV